MAKLVTNYYVFGVSKLKPLRGFPPGNIRLRLRKDEFALAFVRDESGTRCFHIKHVDGYWQPDFERGANLTP